MCLIWPCTHVAISIILNNFKYTLWTKNKQKNENIPKSSFQNLAFRWLAAESPSSPFYYLLWYEEQTWLSNTHRFCCPGFWGIPSIKVFSKELSTTKIPSVEGICWSDAMRRKGWWKWEQTVMTLRNLDGILFLAETQTHEHS